MDDVPPDPITDYTLMIHSGSVTLEWSNPPEDFAYLQIRRGDDAVVGADDGQVVYEGSSTNIYVDEGLVNGATYFYGFIVYDEAGNHSDVVQAVATLPAPGEVVDFPDAGLAAAVRSALGLPEGRDITSLDLLRLSRLDASGRDIHDLTGLRYAVNLQTLDLSGNRLEQSLEGQVSQLANLRSLDVGDNALTAMPNLATMPHLSDLSVAGNLALTSVGTVAAIPSLSRLDVSHTGVRELTALAPATSLLELNLIDTRISDLSPIADFSELRILYITDSDVKDLEPLMGLTSLETLSAAHEGIEDVLALALLPNLKDVNLAENAIHDLQGLVDNANLGVSDRVNLSNNPLLHQAVAVEIPALQGRGVELILGSLQLPTELVGVWHQPSVSVNGAPVDAASFFEWEPDSVDMRLSLYFNDSYLAEELDAAGAVPYFDSGRVQVDADNIVLRMTQDNGAVVDPPEDVMAGTWSTTGDGLELSFVDGSDAIVLHWTR